MRGASRHAKARPGRLGAPLLVFALGLVLAPQTFATSPLKVREVFPGSTTTDPKAEYVVLQMTADGQNDIDGQVLKFYDSTGSLASSYTVPADVTNGSSQRTVLLATQEAAGPLGATAPDFNVGSGTDRMDPAGGAVCLTGSGAGFEDCVTWGSMPLQSGFGTFPNPQLANAAAIADDSVLRRKITPNCPTYLEVADDTNNSATDFAQVSPAPRNNASSPTETRCPPDTVINSFPTNPTNQTSAAFTYAAVPTEPLVSFKCKLDSEAFALCPNAGKSYPGPLADGSHTFQVKAVGEGGEDPTAKSFTWTVDTNAPETTIDSAPANPSGGFSATFAFHSSEPSSSFQCQLDSGVVQVCSGSKTYINLIGGPHTFFVWATDNAGNKDASAATYTWSVDTAIEDRTPPDTLIVSSPSNPSPSASASFTYASTEQGSSFQCSLNSSPFASCPAAGVSYSKLRNGSYVFAVRATDKAGNVDSVPVTYAWTIAAPLPKVTITKAPPGKINLKRGAKASVLFKFKADKAGSSFRCRLDKKAFAPCSSTTKLKAPVGKHRFEVYAIDELGNVGTSTTRRIFRVARARGGGLF